MWLESVPPDPIDQPPLLDGQHGPPLYFGDPSIVQTLKINRLILLERLNTTFLENCSVLIWFHAMLGRNYGWFHAYVKSD